MRRSVFLTVLLLGLAGLPPGFAQRPLSIPARTVADADKLDLNTATPTQLRALKGMGDAYVKRIVEGRPYTAKNQLATRGILPQAAYDAIKDQIIAHAPRR